MPVSSHLLRQVVRLSIEGMLSVCLVGLVGCQIIPERTIDHSAHLPAPAKPEIASLDSAMATPLQPSRSPLLVTPGLLLESQPAVTYSLAVSRVNVQDFLFALARDAKLNIDIHPDIQGTVSLNAVKQTLPQVLERLSKQVDLRYELVEGVLRILPDTPFLTHYPVDYVNINRQVTSTVSANTQISSAPNTDLRTLAQSASSSGNISNTRVENTGTHQFWKSLERNIQEILRETDQFLPDGNSDTMTEDNRQSIGTGIHAPSTARAPHRPGNGGTPQQQPLPPLSPIAESNESQHRETTVVRRRTFREAASVIVNPEGGLISVRATARQHASVKSFLQQILKTAHRQVLIEATVIEVELSDGYQQGIDWSRVREDGGHQFSLTRADVGGDPSSGILPFALRSQDKRNPLSNILAIDLLRSFGKVKVLSSPRLAVLNNQTALLKVVENIIYFSACRAHIAESFPRFLAPCQGRPPPQTHPR